MRHLNIVILAAAIVASATVHAETYPTRPVRMIVPFAPGGVTDFAARVVGQQLSVKWRQPVVIENKPGAGGLIGVEAAAHAPPDGYTLLMASNGEITINPAIFANLRYDSEKDLAPIVMVTSTPFVWSANEKSGIKSLSELVARAKEKPGEITYSSAGIGSSAHMATEQFAAATGIKLLHIPYRGGAPAATAVVSGEVSIAAIAISSAMPVISAKTVKLLATTASQRSSLIPDVPTVNETGVLKTFESAIWTGIFAPAGTPGDILAKVEADVIEALKDPGVVQRLKQAGADPVGMPAAQLKAFIPKELSEFKKTAKEAKIELK